MDDSSKPNESNSNTSGQIFSDNEKSAYQEAVFSPEEANLPPPQPGADPQYSPPDTGSEPPPPDTFSGPPPFVVDPRRKFMVIGLIIIIIFIIIFFAVRILSSRNKPKPDTALKEKITLNYWGLWEEAEVIRPVIEEYQKNNQLIEIKYQRMDPVDYRERLQATIDRGEGPDIFRYHNTWIPMMVKYLSPLPKDTVSDNEFTKTFYPVVESDLKIGSNFYGLPLEIDGLLLFYNEDILRGANVPVPKTWVDVQNAVPKLTVKNGNRIVTSAIALGTAENIEHFSDILGVMMLQNGTNLNKSLFACPDPNTTDCAVEALTFYRKFAAVPNNTWDDSLENSILAFAGGKVAMIFAPSWQAHVISEINPNLKFKTAKLPQLPCNQDPCPEINWATYWVEGVSAKGEHQKEAWQFLKYLVSKETQTKLYSQQSKIRKLFGEPFSRVDLGSSLDDNPYLSPLMSMAPNMKSFYLSSRTDDGKTGLNSSLIDYLKNAVNSLKDQGVSEETALKTADRGFAEVFKRFNISQPQ